MPDLPTNTALPSFLADLFWDYEWQDISWKANPDFIISRILATGGLQAIQWLVETLDREPLRHWLLSQKRCPLDPRRIGFWQLILDLPSEVTDKWIEEYSQSSWHQRLAQ